MVCYGDSADRADFPDAGAEADKPFLTPIHTPELE